MTTYKQAIRWVARKTVGDAQFACIELIAFIFNKNVKHVSHHVKEKLNFREIDKRLEPR